MSNNLILRALTSPYNDITKASVLSHSDVDNNFIFLKGNIIYTAITDGSNVILKKYNGDDFSISTGFNGGIVTGDTTFLNGLTANTISTNDITLSGTSLTSILDNTVKKYSQTLTSPTAGRYTITHNLGTTDISVSLWLAFSNELTNAKILNRLPNSVDVEFSVSPSEDVLVLIMGTTVNSSGVAYIYSAVTVGPNQIAYGDATGLITSNSTFVRNPISGNIGVGVTSPSAKLHINNTGTDNTVLFEDNTNPDSTPFVIDNSGNVGVGTLTASTKLDVRGTFNLQPSSNTYLRYDSFMLDAQVGSSNIGLTLNVDNFGGSQLRGLSAYLVTPTSSFGIGNNTWFRENDKIIFSSTDNYVRGWWDIQNSRFKIGGGGYVPIYSSVTSTLHVSGDFRVDGGTNPDSLYVGTNGNVGIGTSTPDSKLVIKGSDSSSSSYGLKVQDSGGTNNLVVKNNGNVGINISNPSYQLEVLPKDLTGATNVIIRNTSTSPNWSNVSFSVTNGSNHGIGMSASGNGVDTVLNINSGAYSYLSHSVNGIGVAELLTAGVGQLLWRLPDTFQFRRRATNNGWVNFDSLNQRVSIGNEYIGTPTISARLGLRGDTNTSSSYSLVIQNSGGTNTLVVRDDGNVGIGTATPDSKLVIKGSDSSSSNFGLKVQDSGGTDNLVVRNDATIIIGNPNEYAGSSIYFDRPNRKIYINGNADNGINGNDIDICSRFTRWGSNNGTGFGVITEFSSLHVHDNFSSFKINKHAYDSHDSYTSLGVAWREGSGGMPTSSIGSFIYNRNINLDDIYNRTLNGIKIDTSLGSWTNTTGTSTNIGLNVTVGNADVNYAAVFNGGNVGIGTSTPTSTLDINGTNGYNQLRLRTSFTPTGSTDTRGNVGDIAWDDNNFYWKTSTQWLRVSGQTF